MYFISVLENIKVYFFLIVAPCILVTLKFLSPTNAFVGDKNLNIKIYIKIYIKTAPTYFGLRPSSGSLHMSLVKVTFIK
jgi:hypothetical protein